MKLPPFNHAEKSWDRFKAFHVTLGRSWSVGWGHYCGNPGSNIVQFEDGSLMMNAPKHHDRTTYRELHLSIGTPQELAKRGATSLQEDGSKMPTAWLYKDEDNDTRSPTFVLDTDTKRAYSFAPWELLVETAAANRAEHYPPAPVLAAEAVLRVMSDRAIFSQPRRAVDIKSGSELDI